VDTDEAEPQYKARPGRRGRLPYPGTPKAICDICGAEYLVAKGKYTCSAKCRYERLSLWKKKKMSWLLAETVD